MTVWRTQLRDPQERLHDVFVDGEVTTSTEALERELEQLGFHAKPIGFHGVPIRSAATIGALGLAHGSTLTCGALAPEPALPGVGRHLVVVCGPDAGRHVPLPSGGGVTIGRSARADLHLDDSLLSGLHCRIDHARIDGADTVTVTDLGSTNGTSVEGVEITGPTELHGRTYLQVGSSVLAVVDVTRADIAVVGELDGAERVFPRQYRPAQSALPPKVEAPSDRGSSGPSSGGMWWRALLPLVTGFGFAAITGRWIFLLIMIIGPIVMAIEAFRRKRRRERDVADAAATLRLRPRRVPRERPRPPPRGARPAPVGGALWRVVAARRVDVASTDVGAGGVGRRLHERSRRLGGDPVGDRRRRPRRRVPRAAVGHAGREQPAAHRFARHRRPARPGAVGRPRCGDEPRDDALAGRGAAVDPDDRRRRRRLGIRPVAAAHVRGRRRLPDRGHRDRPRPAHQEHQGAARHPGRVRRQRGGERESVQLPVHVVIVDGTDLLQPGELAELLGTARATASSA